MFRLTRQVDAGFVSTDAIEAAELDDDEVRRNSDVSLTIRIVRPTTSVTVARCARQTSPTVETTRHIRRSPLPHDRSHGHACCCARRIEPDMVAADGGAADESAVASIARRVSALLPGAAGTAAADDGLAASLADGWSEQVRRVGGGPALPLHAARRRRIGGGEAVVPTPRCARHRNDRSRGRRVGNRSLRGHADRRRRHNLVGAQIDAGVSISHYCCIVCYVVTMTRGRSMRVSSRRTRSRPPSATTTRPTTPWRTQARRRTRAPPRRSRAVYAAARLAARCARDGYSRVSCALRDANCPPC